MCLIRRWLKTRQRANACDSVSGITNFYPPDVNHIF
jgi:hypothetical protein